MPHRIQKTGEWTIMPNFFDEIRDERPVIPVILVVDASGSMAGERIDAVNNVIAGLVGYLARLNDMSDTHMKYAILQYESNAIWLTNGLAEPEDGLPPELRVGGMTAFGEALATLNDKLSVHGFLDSRTSRAPIVIFFFEGMPTDEYEEPLKHLLANKWYQHAVKLVLCMSDAYGEEELLKKLVDSTDGILPVEDPSRLKDSLSDLIDLLQAITVTASIGTPPFDRPPTAPPTVRNYHRPRPEKSIDDFFDADPACVSMARSWDSDPMCTSVARSMSSSPVCRSVAFPGLANATGNGVTVGASASSFFFDDSDFFDSDPLCTTVVLSPDSGSTSRSSDPADDPRPIMSRTSVFGEDEDADFFAPVSRSMPVRPSDLPSPANHTFVIPTSSNRQSTESLCPTCGESIGARFKFCPVCGTPVGKSHDAPVLSQVQFSAVAPRQILKGEYAMIDVTAYEDAYRHIVDRIIANADTEVREVIASPQEVEKNTRIRIRLSSPDVEVEDCDETQVWRGRYLTYSFPVMIPASYAKRQILFLATVYFNDVIATRLKIIVPCTSSKEHKLQISREDVLTAFISYASQDRSRVATIIQGMQKARPDMDIFFDVESLRSGDDWECALHREIEKRDVLYLCWSHHAKASAWVENEWRYALANKGLDGIEPIPLVPPADCPPPEELKSKHFNDRALLYKGNGV